MAVREAVEDLNAAKANPSQMQHVDIGKSIIVSFTAQHRKIWGAWVFALHTEFTTNDDIDNVFDRHSMIFSIIPPQGTEI